VRVGEPVIIPANDETDIAWGSNVSDVCIIRYGELSGDGRVVSGGGC
jgi:hypothetical protein